MTHESQVSMCQGSLITNNRRLINLALRKKKFFNALVSLAENYNVDNVGCRHGWIQDHAPSLALTSLV